MGTFCVAPVKKGEVWWRRHVTFGQECDNQPKRKKKKALKETRFHTSRLRATRGRPAVPEQRSGERVVSPGAAASGPLALNGHRVNPLKVHPSAAATGQSEESGGRQRRPVGREGEEGKGKEEPVSGKSEAALQSSCTKSEAEDLGLGLSAFFPHTRLENIGGVIKTGRCKGFRGSSVI